MAAAMVVAAKAALAMEAATVGVARAVAVAVMGEKEMVVEVMEAETEEAATAAAVKAVATVVEAKEEAATVVARAMEEKAAEEREEATGGGEVGSQPPCVSARENAHRSSGCSGSVGHGAGG